VLVPALCLAAVVPALTSCSLLFGGGDLDDALDLVPVDASRVVFRDREAIAERLGIDDVEPGAAEDDLVRYAEAVAGDATGSTDLLTEFLLPMQDAAMSELDVVWSVEAAVEEGVYTAYKVDGDADLDAVADELAAAGYTEDEVDGRRHLSLTGERAPAYPGNWLEVTVDPDEDLLVVGTAEPVLALVDDEAESVYDADTYDDLLADADDVQFALVTAPPTCGAGARATPEQVEASGLGDLGSPERTAYLVSGDDATTSARLELADEEAAEADLEARRTYVDEGTLAATARPVSSLGDISLERDGAVLQVDLDLAEPRTGLDVAQQQDGFLACTPPPDDPDDEPTEAPGDPSGSPTEPTEPSATVTADGPTEESTVELP
jgi:hypothetical protein